MKESIGQTLSSSFAPTTDYNVVPLAQRLLITSDNVSPITTPSLHTNVSISLSRIIIPVGEDERKKDRTSHAREIGASRSWGDNKRALFFFFFFSIPVLSPPRFLSLSFSLFFPPLSPDSRPAPLSRRCAGRSSRRRLAVDPWPRDHAYGPDHLAAHRHPPSPTSRALLLRHPLS